jgi:hypothetical protein
MTAFFKGRFRLATRRREGLRDSPRPMLGEFQEMLKVDDSLGASATQVYLLGTERREHQKLIARARDCDIKPSVASHC